MPSQMFCQKYLIVYDEIIISNNALFPSQFDENQLKYNLVAKDL